MSAQAPAGPSVGLGRIAREWLRIGCIGFGGPPAHIALFRRRFVEERGWISSEAFEDGLATVNLLPGPASTQLAIFCAWMLRGPAGAIVGGLSFICPGLLLILVLSAVFLAGHPPSWVLGAAAGAGAAVPAVAVAAAWSFVPASWARVGTARPEHLRWLAYAAAGAASAATVGPYLALVLIACGLVEVAVRRPPPGERQSARRPALLAAVGHATGGWAGLAWLAFKVGALSYGGGFVIIPLMQHDAVVTYHFMTGAQFLNAVALGQVTPGPVVLTVGVVGYAAHGVGGALFAVAIAFAPSFAFVLAGAPRFAAIRTNRSIQAFLTGAGPAVIGAIGGSAISLARELQLGWQFALLAGAFCWLLVLRRGTVSVLLLGGAIGVLLALAGVAVTR